MSKEKEEYIQLPPMKRNTDVKVVEMIWEYSKVSKKSRDHVHKQLRETCKMDESEEVTFPEHVEAISHEEIAGFEETMRKVISQVTYEACDLACWIYECKYVRRLSMEEMLQEKPEKETFVIAMNMILEQFEQEDAGMPVS